MLGVENKFVRTKSFMTNPLATIVIQKNIIYNRTYYQICKGILMSIPPEQEIEILVFLRNLSHELRSPLASILGYAELILLSEEELSEEIKTNAQAIYNNGNKLQEIIDKIQDYRNLISSNK